MKVYLDLDGVLVNFVQGVLEIFNLPFPDPWPIGEYSLAQAIGKTDKEFWRAIDAHGYKFWEDLQPYPYAEELYERLQKEYTVFFCSTPSQSVESLKGKMLWLNNFTATNCRNYIFTPAKHLLASKDCVLIDDYDQNVAKFRDAGGATVVFPQKWNSACKFTENKLEFVFSQLSSIEKGLINGTS